jgi:hypothetical protein
VQCPKCKHRFRAVHLKFFGMPSGWLKWLLLGGAVSALLLLILVLR